MKIHYEYIRVVANTLSDPVFDYPYRKAVSVNAEDLGMNIL